MRYIILIIASIISLLSFSSGSLAQSDSAYVYTFKDKNFFRQRGWTALFDYGITPSLERHWTTTDDITGLEKDTFELDRNEWLSLYAFTYETRLNFVNYRDWFSASVAVPATLALSIYTGRYEGVFNLRLPVIVDVNFFNHATYNNINRWGFNVGAGYMLTMGPLIHGKDYELPIASIMPVFRAGVKFPFRDNNSFVNFYYGPGKVETDGDGKNFHSNQFFNITYGRMINYD